MMDASHTDGIVTDGIGSHTEEHTGSGQVVTRGVLTSNQSSGVESDLPGAATLLKGTKKTPHSSKNRQCGSEGSPE